MPEPADRILSHFDESFRPDEPERYSLVMEVEKQKFSYSLLDVEKNKFVGIGSFPRPYSEVIASIGWITRPFRTKRVIFANCRSTLIPAALFSEDDRQEYLDFNVDRENDDIVHHDWLENLGIYNIYPVPGQARSDIGRLFPGAGLCHVSTVLMESLYVNYKNVMGEGKIFMNVRHEEFDLVIFKGKQLIYCNSFPFRSPEDLVYYLIFVMEQMNLNPEESPLILLGATERRSRVYDLLYRYIRTIEFAARNETFGYSYLLDDLPGHSFYTLFNSEQCGL